MARYLCKGTQIIFFVLLILNLTSCENERGITGVNLSEVTEVSLSKEDFTVTIQTPSTTVAKGDDILVDGSLEYTGIQDQIAIFHSQEFYDVNVQDETGKSVFTLGRDDVAIESILSKDDFISFGYMIPSTFPKGKYKIIVDIEFYLENNPDKIYSLKPELEINIE
jgi:hypothetical protein